MPGEWIYKTIYSRFPCHQFLHILILSLFYKLLNSCGPNCYPKIIILDGAKRVVVYAKRDIKAGEELCYDYKFDLEYDPQKRIPCICRAPECRGFMNWDQRYVTSTNDDINAGSLTNNKNQRGK